CGGICTTRGITKAGRLDVIPCHVSSMPGLIRDGIVTVDVLMVQVSPPNEKGEYSPALANDFLRVAADKPRVVIAEGSARVPQAPCTSPFTAADIDVVVETDRPLIQLPAAKVGELERQVAKHVDTHIP